MSGRGNKSDKIWPNCKGLGRDTPNDHGRKACGSSDVFCMRCKCVLARAVTDAPNGEIAKLARPLTRGRIGYEPGWAESFLEKHGP